MTQKRKISARKILQAIVTLLLLCGGATAVLSTTKLQANRVIAGIDVTVVNNNCRFVDKDEIRKQLLKEEIKVKKTKLKEVNIHKVESLLANNPWVAAAEVYVDNAKEVKVSVVQRVPVVRLFNVMGKSYYLDSTAHVIPLSQRYVHYTTTVINVPVYEDAAMEKLNKEIVKLSNHIEQDSFWNAQVSHIVVTEKGEFELVPVLGKHKIKLGSTDRLQEKFKNLFTFYVNVLNRVGWDKYEVLDVRYKGQLVGSPSIQWNIPIDNVRSRINWVSSITGEAPKPIFNTPLPNNTVPKENTTSEQSLPVESAKKENVNTVGEKEKKSEAEKETNTPIEDKKIKKETKEPKYIYQGN